MARLVETGMPVALAELVEYEGDLLELELPHGDCVAIRRILAECFGRCDILVAKDTIAVPHLLVSDMDSTIIGQECIDELADYAGIKPQIAAITDRAMQGELDFEQALRERVALLAGLSESAIEACLADRIRPTEGAAMLLDTLREYGCHTVLVTGGFHHFADAVGQQLGFERTVANRLAVAGGVLTGKVIGRVSDASTKAAVLREERSRLGDRAVVLALGDGANDAPILAEADYGIAFRAKQAALDVANGSVGRGDLTAVLRLLGLWRRSATTL